MIMNKTETDISLTAMDMIQQVVSTLAIENMFIDEEIKKNLLLIATNQRTSQEVIKELDKRYA